MMDLRNRSVSISQDSESGKEVIKVKNEQTGEVIRQMPTEEMLAFMRNLTKMLGAFFDKSSWFRQKRNDLCLYNLAQMCKKTPNP